MHTYRTGSIKALGETPLALVHLRRSAGDVVGRGVAQYVVHSIGLTDVFGVAADDDGHLGLVVPCVVDLSDLGQDRRGGPGVGQRGCRLQKQGRELGDRHRHFVCV